MTTATQDVTDAQLLDNQKRAAALGVTIPGPSTTRYSETTTPGTTPSTGATPPPAATPTPTVSRYTAAGDAAFGAGGSLASTPVNESQIRKQTLKDAQPGLDAVNEMMNVELADARARGAQLLGKSRALSNNAGLIGSGTGDKFEQGARDVQTKEESAIRAAALEKVAALNAGIASRSDELIKNAKTLAQTNGAAYLSYLKDSSEKAAADMKELATAGADISPETKQHLIEQTGYDEKTFDSLYQSLKIANSDQYLNKDKPFIQGNQAVYLKKVKKPDGTMGIEQEVVDLPEAFGKTIEQTVARDDGIYVFYGDGTYKKVGAPKGGDVTPGDNPQLYAGLSTPTATAVRAKVNQFKGEQNVTNFSTVQDGYNFASSLNTDTTNPADDQALVYALAKALDPGSVVREGEYATAQKYSQSWIQAYGKGVEQALLGTGFLGKTARDNIKKVIKTKYDAQKKSYDQTSKSYTDGINALTGRSDGSKFITDYVTPAGGGSVKERAEAAGYDYEAMRAANYSDEAIDAQLPK